MGQYAQLRFLFIAAAGFNTHFGDVEQPVKHVLAGIDVLNSRKRNVTFVAEDQAGSNYQLAIVVAEPESQVAND